MIEYLKKAVARPPESDEAVRAVVEEILGAVRREGDVAVRRYSEKLDRWSPVSFKLSAAEIEAAIAGIGADDRAMIDYCRDQIAAFARRQRASLTEFEIELQDGVRLGQKLIPVATVGAYVPGGRYPLVASALMSITTAKVAGVGRVIACSPPPSKTVTYQRLTRKASGRVAPIVARICEIEGMLAHKATADLRETRYGKD